MTRNLHYYLITVKSFSPNYQPARLTFNISTEQQVHTCCLHFHTQSTHKIQYEEKEEADSSEKHCQKICRCICIENIQFMDRQNNYWDTRKQNPKLPNRNKQDFLVALLFKEYISA